MDDSQFRATLIKRLNVLISIALDAASETTYKSTAEKVDHLISLGLSPAEIAQILGKPTNYVTALVHTKKKRLMKRETKNARGTEGSY